MSKVEQEKIDNKPVVGVDIKYAINKDDLIFLAESYRNDVYLQAIYEDGMVG